MLEDGVLPSLFMLKAYVAGTPPPVDQPRLAVMPPLKSKVVIGDDGGGGGDDGGGGGDDGGGGGDGGTLGRFRSPAIPAPPIRKRLGVPAAMAREERAM